MSAPSDSLVQPGVPVFVWTGGMTISSGEIVSIAFRGRPNTTFLGDWTKGVPTCNSLFEVEHFGSLFLTTGQCTDRNGVTYLGPIEPDHKIEVPKPLEGELMRNPAFQERLAENTKELMAKTRECLGKLKS